MNICSTKNWWKN